MTLLRSLFERRQLNDPRYPLTSQRLVDTFAGPSTDAGVRVSETSALTLPAVWRAISIIAQSIASLPLRAFRDRPDGRVEVDAAILRAPYPDTTEFEFWEYVCTCLLTNGNAYLLKIRNDVGDRVVRLLPVPPASVAVQRGRSTGLNPSGKTYRVQVAGGKTAEYTPYELMHIPGLSTDGIVGLSPIGMARQALGLGLAEQEFAARFYGNGSLLGGIITTEQEVPEEAAETLKRRWREKVAGIARAHEIAILDRGATFTRVGIPPQEAQFIEGRVFSIAEVARIYGVPLHLLMDAGATSNWGTGVAQHGAQFVTYSLRAYMSRIEQRVTMHLLPRGNVASFDDTALLRGSTAERYATYQIGLAGGWLTIDEIRDWEGLSPAAGEAVETGVEG